MPRPDPLDNIMGQLRAHGGIDPNQQAARQADLRQQRQQVGATPEGTRQPPQPARGEGGMPQDVMPATPESPEGISPDFQEQPNMMGVVVDALNEAIIGLKTEIHRSPEPETKRKLEKQAQNIRDAVMEMEGDPVWGDESIDEGLKKLRGLGAVGMGGYRPRAQAQQRGLIQPQQPQPQQETDRATTDPNMEQVPPHMQVEHAPATRMPEMMAQQHMREPAQDPFGGWQARRRQIFERMQQQVGQGGTPASVEQPQQQVGAGGTHDWVQALRGDR